MKIGFIGTGKITSSIIYGIFKSKLKISRIYISSRNKSGLYKLSNKFKPVIVIHKKGIDNSSLIWSILVFWIKNS